MLGRNITNGLKQMNARTMVLGAVLSATLLALPMPSSASSATPFQDGRGDKKRSPMEMGQPDFTTADQVLDALEDVHIAKLTANVRYTQIKEFLGEREMSIGSMQFTSTPRTFPDQAPDQDRPERKKFAVAFDNLIIGNVLDEQPKIYIFDGHWFVEKMPKEKLIIKREVVRPGEVVDPLRIGEGPFPIPIGQKKADILSRFDAELLPADDGLTLDPADPAAPADPDIDDDPDAAKDAAALVNFAKDAYQIRLTPKALFKDTLDLVEVRLWYRRDKPERGGTLLPRMARTVDIDGNISIIQLIRVRVGDAADIDEAMFDVAVPTGWTAQITDFQG